MSSLDLDNVLKRVAAGDLSPEEALRLLDTGTGTGADPAARGTAGPDAGAESGAKSSADASADAGAPHRTGSGPAGPGLLHEPPTRPGHDDLAAERPASPRQEDVRTVRLTVAYRDLTIIGDASVAQVHVSGSHSVRRDGAVLVIDAGAGAWPEPERGGRFSFANLPWSMGLRNWGEHALTVRVNPRLQLDLDATGCSVKLSGLEAGARLRLLACSLKLDRLRGPVHLDAVTSSIKGSLAPTGESSLSSEQSSVKVWLLPGTNLRIQASNRMSKLALPGQVRRSGGALSETMGSTVGDGRDLLQVEAVMSSISISAESRAATGTVHR